MLFVFCHLTCEPLDHTLYFCPLYCSVYLLSPCLFAALITPRAACFRCCLHWEYGAEGGMALRAARMKDQGPPLAELWLCSSIKRALSQEGLYKHRAKGSRGCEELLMLYIAEKDKGWGRRRSVGASGCRWRKEWLERRYGGTAYGTRQSFPFLQTSLSAIFQVSAQHRGNRADLLLTDPGTGKAPVLSSALSAWFISLG